jgi:hypothetical protein
MKKNIKDIKDINDISYVLEKTLSKLTFWMSLYIWIRTIGVLIYKIIGAIIGTAWASLLIAYTYTDDNFYLKLFILIPSIMIITYFQIYWIQAIIKYRNNKKYSLFDMSKMNEPDKNDVNNIFFKDVSPRKYKVIDEKEKRCHNKEYFLYPVLARLNPNGTMSFFKENQLEEINTNDK